jgi:hypothetical protein
MVMGEGGLWWAEEGLDMGGRVRVVVGERGPRERGGGGFILQHLHSGTGK